MIRQFTCGNVRLTRYSDNLDAVEARTLLVAIRVERIMLDPNKVIIDGVFMSKAAFGRVMVQVRGLGRLCKLCA